MSNRRFSMTASDLPQTLPVFPLGNTLLLPGGELPLNVFEPRYVQMVRDALASRNPYIGIILPKGDCNCGCSCGSKAPLYEVGCAGKISSFNETADGRFLITLIGICRFRISEELDTATPYRIVKPYWNEFAFADLAPCDCCIRNMRPKLIELLHPYFETHGMMMDWDRVEDIPDERLMTCLSMVCPFEPAEQQALLEAPSNEKRCGIMMTLIDFAMKSAVKSDKQ